MARWAHAHGGASLYTSDSQFFYNQGDFFFKGCGCVRKVIFLDREEIIKSHEGENYRLAAAGLLALTRRACVGRRVAVTPDPVCFAQINEKKEEEERKGHLVSLFLFVQQRRRRGWGRGPDLTEGPGGRAPRIKSNSGKIHIKPRQSPRHPWSVAGWRPGGPPSLFFSQSG